jgi:hypothetical protein
MRRTALLLLVIASQALAQSPTQPKQQEPERKAAPGEPRLNLRLEESDLRSLSRSNSGPPAPAEEKSADGLPSLGGDARKIEPPPPASDSRRPYPADTQMISR